MENIVKRKSVILLSKQFFSCWQKYGFQNRSKCKQKIIRPSKALLVVLELYLCHPLALEFIVQQQTAIFKIISKFLDCTIYNKMCSATCF